MKTLLSGCLLAVSATIMIGCHGGESAPLTVEQTMQARVVDSRQLEAPQMLRSTGTVHARETAQISAQVMGRIQQVLVRAGDGVRAGQTLIVLDYAALRASADQAHAAVKAAEPADGGRDRRPACSQHAGSLPAV